MIIVDKTGRKLKVGQTVDVMLLGMFQGDILQIKDSPISIPGHQPILPHIAIAVVSTPFIAPNGMVHDVYIIGESQNQKKDMDKESKGGILIDLGRGKVTD